MLFEGTAYECWICQRLSLVVDIGNRRRYLLHLFAAARSLKEGHSEKPLRVFYFANDSHHLVRMKIHYLPQFRDGSEFRVWGSLSSLLKGP